MKPRIGWLVALLGLSLSAMTLPGYAQLDDALGGLSDENLEGYLEPLNTGLSGTMNSAVFRTGYIPKSGFTVMIGAAAMAIEYGDEDLVYTPTDPEGFNSIEQIEAPTVVGNADGATAVSSNGLQFHYPGGFELESFQIAVPELTIGAVFGTQAKVRYIAFDTGDADIGDFKYFGIGAQHSITQYVGEAPPVDVAVGIFYQSFKIGEDIVDASAFHANVTGSKQFGTRRLGIQPYVGVGIDQVELSVEVDDEDDPENSVDVTLDSVSDFRFTAGVVGSVPGVSAFFEFNVAATTGLALGIAFGI
jgi:hypothetical protein